MKRRLVGLGAGAADARSELGSVMACFDADRRFGAELTFSDGHSTSSRVNAAGVQFGLDWGAPAEWSTLGRPPHSVGVLALAVHDGDLYAGTLGDDGLGRVFVYRDGWSELPGATRANCVNALASHDGALHIGTTRYRTGGSALDLPANDEPGGDVLRWGHDGWASVGRPARGGRDRRPDGAWWPPPRGRHVSGGDLAA